MAGAPGGTAPGGECPPATAFGRRLLFYFAPRGSPTRVQLAPRFKSEKAGKSRFPASLRSEPGVACGLSGRNKGGGIRRRRIPGDIRPESPQATPGPSGWGDLRDRTKGVLSSEWTKWQSPTRRPRRASWFQIGRAHV